MMSNKFTIRLVLVVFLMMLIPSSISSTEAPLGSFQVMPVSLRQHFFKTKLRGSDFLAFSETCRQNRHAAVEVLKQETGCQDFEEIIGAFKRGRPKVVRAILHRFPDMSPSRVEGALKRLRLRNDADSQDRADALYRSVQLRLQHRISDRERFQDRIRDHERTIENAVSHLLYIGTFGDDIPEDLINRATYLLAKTQALDPFLTHLPAPDHTLDFAFTILSKQKNLDPIEQLEANMLRALCRLGGWGNDLFLTEEEARSVWSRDWQRLIGILEDHTSNPKERMRVLWFMYTFLLRTKGYSEVYESWIPEFSNAWEKTLAGFCELLKPEVGLLPLARKNLREAKLRFLVESPQFINTPYFAVEGLLNEFTNPVSISIDLAREYQAETVLAERMEVFAQLITNQSLDFLPLLRRFLLDYVRYSIPKGDKQKDTKGRIIEALFNRLLSSHKSLERSLPVCRKRFQEVYVSKDELWSFMQDKEIMDLIQMEKGPLRTRHQKVAKARFLALLEQDEADNLSGQKRTAEEAFDSSTEENGGFVRTCSDTSGTGTLPMIWESE